MKRQEDMKLIAGFLKGDKKAFAKIDTWIYIVVRNGNWRMGSDVQDIMQDVRLKLFENFKEKRFNYRSTLKTYVWRVTKYTCIDHLRCRKHMLSIDDTEMELVDHRENPEESLYHKEQRALFLKIFQSLPRHCRDLWRMTWHEKLHYTQIAERLSISEGTVKSRLSRCRKKAIDLGRKFSGNFDWAGSTIHL